MHLRRLGAAFATLALTSSLVVAGSAAAGPPDGAAASRWIVQLRPGTDAASVAAEHSSAHGARTGHVYEHAIQGYSAIMSAEAAARVARDPRVDHVERDQVVTAFGEVPTGVDRIADAATNNDAIANLTIDGADDERVDVDVAVIDTGVDGSHPDLNVVSGVDCTGAPWNNRCVAGTATDPNGHGTHVAGTIGALDNGVGVVGVAPGARISSVRVLNNSGSGYMSWIVAGIDSVAARSSTIEVANMSLGCECTSAAMDDAIENAVAEGVTFVVAAGNSAKDASTFSPANNSAVITVSALADGDGKSGGSGTTAIKCRSGEVDDRLASFSNFGSAVEVTAPGVCITSTWPGGGLKTISGTSMASPHVAGAAALVASGASALSPAQVRSTLVADGVVDWFDQRDGHEEPRVDVTGYAPATLAGPDAGTGGDGGGGGGGENVAPTVTITAQSCTGTTCSFSAEGEDTDGGPSGLTYAWTFGDGGTATGASVSHRYGGSGTTTYTVTVTVSDGAAQADDSTTTTCTGKGKRRSCTTP